MNHAFRAATCLIVCLFSASMALAGPSKLVDKRKEGSSSRKFIMFCSRDSPGSTSLPGHAFVLFGDAPQGQEQGPTVITRGAGFYPKDQTPVNELKALLVRVPGQVINDYLAGAIPAEQCRLLVRVEEADYNQAIALTEAFKTQGYNLFGNSCVNLVKDVANKLGLATTSDAGLNNFPERFLRKLIEMNGVEANVNSSRPIVIP